MINEPAVNVIYKWMKTFWGPLVFVLTMAFWAGAFYSSSTAQSAALSELKKDMDETQAHNATAHAASIKAIKELQSQQFKETQQQIADNLENTRELGVNLKLSNAELYSKLAVISRDVQHLVKGLEKLEQRSASAPAADYPRLYVDESHGPRRDPERN